MSSHRNRYILELRRKGMTFQDISTELGLAYERTRNLYHIAWQNDLEQRYGNPHTPQHMYWLERFEEIHPRIRPKQLPAYARLPH